MSDHCVVLAGNAVAPEMWGTLRNFEKTIRGVAYQDPFVCIVAVDDGDVMYN